MYVKQLKRKCSVRGCRCTDTFAISLTREVGNSVIICKSCLGKALGAIDDAPPIPETRVSHKDAPPLFFNEKAQKVKTAVSKEEWVTKTIEPANLSDEIPDGITEVAPENVMDEVDKTDIFVCPVCGKVCKSELGLQKHISAAHKEEV